MNKCFYLKRVPNCGAPIMREGKVFFGHHGLIKKGWLNQFEIEKNLERGKLKGLILTLIQISP